MKVVDVVPLVADRTNQAAGAPLGGFTYGVTCTVPVFVDVPALFVAVNVTVKVAVASLPTKACETLLPVAVIPSPKFHVHVGLFVDVLVNVTTSGDDPLVAL